MRRVMLPVCLMVGLLTGCGSEPTKPAVLKNTSGEGSPDAPKSDPPKVRMKGGKGAKPEGATLDP